MAFFLREERRIVRIRIEPSDTKTSCILLEVKDQGDVCFSEIHRHICYKLQRLRVLLFLHFYISRQLFPDTFLLNYMG